MNPNSKEARAAFEKQLFQEIRQENPELTEDEIRSVLGNFSSMLSEANVAIPQSAPATQDPVATAMQRPAAIQQKILSTPAGAQFNALLNAKYQDLKKYLKSPNIAKNIQSSPVLQKIKATGNNILVNKLVEAATAQLNKLKVENVLQNNKENIDKFFKEKNKQQEQGKTLQNPEVKKTLEDGLKNIRAQVKQSYLKQLEELVKKNPAQIAN